MVDLLNHSNKLQHKTKVGFFQFNSILLILISFPFIQLGYTYYISVQILAFILIFFLLLKYLNIKDIPIFIILFIFMEMSVFFFQFSNLDMREVLKVGREFICFIMLYILASNRGALVQLARESHSLRLIIILLVLGMLALVLFQFILLLGSVGFFLPSEYFIRNAGTIPDELDLFYSNIRPSGTFGEPSYQGFVTISLLVIVLSVFDTKKWKLFLTVCLTITVALTQSVSGVFAIMVLLTMYFWSTNRAIISKWMVIALSMIILFAAWYFNYGIFERLANINNPELESSGYYRIIVPLSIMADVLTNYTFGIPSGQLANVYFSGDAVHMLEVAGALSNGFANLIINYGVIGILILILLLQRIKFDLYLFGFLILAMMFNGSFFSFDKTVIVAMVLLFYVKPSTKTYGVQ